MSMNQVLKNRAGCRSPGPE